jgi:hypothetical protein
LSDTPYLSRSQEKRLAALGVYPTRTPGLEKRLVSAGAAAHRKGEHCYCFLLSQDSDGIPCCCFCGETEPQAW